MPNPLFVVKLGNWAILNDCMLGGMLNEGLIMFSWQHDIQSPKNTVACKYETFFCGKKKMVVGCELVGERREEEIR